MKNDTIKILGYIAQCALINAKKLLMSWVSRINSETST